MIQMTFKKFLPYSSSLLLLLLLITLFSMPVMASDLGLTEADCRCCHGPTLADRHHMLVNTEALECLSCHAMVLNPTTMQYDAVMTRDCIQCHTGSLADRHHVLVDQVTVDCFSCHAMVLDPVSMMYVADFNVSCQPPPTQPGVLLGSVNGTVTDPSGTELSWARVATSDNSLSTLATETGYYQLADVPDGSYELVASLDGYVSATQTATVSNGQAVLADFVLPPLVNPGSITGVVRDANLSPIQGAKISSASGFYSAVSATDGRFALVDVTEGSYILTAEKTGFVATSQSAAVSPGMVLTTDFILPALPVEICSDGIDNDANGLTDCEDPACADTPACLPIAVEICDDDIDNDSNGLTDCGDPACMATAACPPPIAEVCGDGIDNNGDGLVDCADPACTNTKGCSPENCIDGIDNNSDGLIDCTDPVCVDNSNCQTPPVEICDDGLDNDGDGLVDCGDPKCAEHSSCYQPAVEENCSNGVDDNGDGYIDCADTQCMNRSICLAEICSNGLDDDGDGKIDCADSECSSDPACNIPESPLPFSVKASDSEEHYEAYRAGDKDMNTRWWVDEDDDEWLRLDLGKIYTVNKVVINWHSEYAAEYRIRVSQNGWYWTTVKEVYNSAGGLDPISFSATKARFILIDCKVANHDGFSIYEIEVHRESIGGGASPEICTDGIDNDLDGLTDCADSDCATAPSCQPPVNNVNLALNKSISASRSDRDYPATNANDGDMSRRWSVSDRWTRTLTVDLGLRMDVDRVVINWHSDYATDYRIRTSNDNSNWTETARESSGNGGTDELTFPTVNARYIQLYCSTAHYNDYSVYEFEIYGPTAAPGAEICTDGIDNDFDGKIDCADSDCAAAPSCQPPPAEVCTDGIDNDRDGKVDCADSDCAAAPSCQPPADAGNLALNKSASATDDEGSSYRASNAVDGNASTSWWTKSSDDESLTVNLGQSYAVSKVIIKWTSNYAEEYEILVRDSDSDSSWRRVANVWSGRGGTETVTFSSRTANEVRITCKKERRDGYQITELEVYK